jgi:hypothetical protein
MPGVLGLTFRSNELAESESEEIARQVGIYKTFRDTLRRASAALLSDQPDHRAEGAWDLLQERGDEGAVVLFAFQQRGGGESVIIKPVGLIEDATYSVESVDRGEVGTATGRELMDNGIEIIQSPVSAAHILTLKVRLLENRRR